MLHVVVGKDGDTMAKLIKGVNDLATVHPELVEEWDYEENAPQRPEDFTAHSNKKMLWRCKLGHSYPARINDRTGKNGSDCPYCTGRKALKGFNDLKTLYPEIAAEWDYKANYPLCPDQVTAGCDKEVIWKCKLGHSYSARIYHRTGKERRGCPYCNGRKILKGFNDLETLRPEIAAEWDYEANYPLCPDQVGVGAHKRIFWRCKLGHSYFAYIYNRTDGHGCPYCVGNLPIKGETDLATKHPHLCKDWDYSKNAKGPDEYTEFSKSLVNWKCHNCGYTYKRRICVQVKGGVCKKCKH